MGDNLLQKFDGKHILGWKVRLIKNRTSYFTYIPKQIVLGAGLKEKVGLYAYLCESKEGRPVFVIYLDRQPK